MDNEDQFPPLCPNCAKPMRFTRLIPAIGAIPEFYSYYCDSCGEAVTEVGGRENGAIYCVTSR